MRPPAAESLGGITGRIAGAAIGSAAGGTIGGSNNADGLAAAGNDAGLGYGTHRTIKAAGGYRAVATKAAPAAKIVHRRMVEAIRRGAMRAA